MKFFKQIDGSWTITNVSDWLLPLLHDAALSDEFSLAAKRNRTEEDIKDMLALREFRCEIEDQTWSTVLLAVQ